MKSPIANTMQSLDTGPFHSVWKLGSLFLPRGSLKLGDKIPCGDQGKIIYFSSLSLCEGSLGCHYSIAEFNNRGTLLGITDLDNLSVEITWIFSRSMDIIATAPKIRLDSNEQ